MHQPVSIRAVPSPPNTVLCHLGVRCLDADGRFFALPAGCPETHIVHQAVYLVIQLLLAFPGAPNLYTVLNEPFHEERRLIFFTTETVKHEHQQNVKFLP